MSVVIASRNGAEGVRRCICALERQTIRPALEIIVVDDGSTDATSEVASAMGATVVLHAANQGVSAARNSGIRAASAPIVAFLDDDCEPSPQWAQALLAGYDAGVVGIGGPVIPSSESGLILSYLGRHNPILPQELDLATSNHVAYRFSLYIRRQWRPARPYGRRAVLSVPSANMSVRRSALLAIGGYDERIRFGSEDEDLCRRLRDAFPVMRFMFEPEAQVVHHFEPSLRATLRRRRAYGRGSAIMYYKWPDVRPTVFPFPALVLAVLASSFRFPVLFAVTLLLPQVCYPQGLRAAVAERRADFLLHAYLQLMEETADDVGFAEGLLSHRKFARERQATPSRILDPEHGTERGG